jgi:hypothetical protein
MTACDDPYIGEQSIIRPPPRKKARMTAAHPSRSSASSPTLNVIQLPSPTTGSFSPVDGIALVRGTDGSGAASADTGRSTAAATLAAIAPTAARRLKIGSSFIVASVQALFATSGFDSRRVSPSVGFG